MNIITINFVPCDPAPANGYNVQWRVFGSEDAYTDAGNFTESPAMFTDDTNPVGTSYEGIIRSDCTESGESGTNYGNNIAWSAISNEESGGVGVTWNYINDIGSGGRMRILVNGVLLVNVTATSSGTLPVGIGDEVTVFVQSQVEGISEIEISGPYTNSTSGPHLVTDEFTTVSGIYVIDGHSL